MKACSSLEKAKAYLKTEIGFLPSILKLHPVIPDKVQIFHPLIPDKAQIIHPLIPDKVQILHPLIPDKAQIFHPVIPDGSNDVIVIGKKSKGLIFLVFAVLTAEILSLLINDDLICKNINENH